MSPRDKWILIVDYNLSRYLDVKHMFEYAKRRYGLKGVLIRPNISDLDRSLADMTVDLDPRSDHFIEQALLQLTDISNDIVAVLPFSDNGVWKGATLARALGQRGDDPSLAENAFSKSSYREHEKILNSYLRPQGIFVPRFEMIRDLHQLRVFARECPSGFVLKPTTEGNNRGVLLLRDGDCLEAAFREVTPYLNSGLIVEELIPFPEEYSWDGLGHLNFVTKKISHHGKYPVEEGQVVGLSLQGIESVERAGRMANLLVGQKMGPFHNEVKFDPKTKIAAVVEPNRRPAGMKIWHLARRVYGIDFFNCWIDQMVTGNLPSNLPVPQGVATIRQLRAPFNGQVRLNLNPCTEEQMLNLILSTASFDAQTEWYDFRILKSKGEFVDTVPKDNAGFMAEVCMYTKNRELNVQNELKKFEDAWKKVAIQMNLMEEVYENLSIA